MAFNRDRNSNRGGGGGFRPRPSFGGRQGERPSFGDRGDRGPVEMHQAICDNCGKECEVPFRPTQGKPIFCSNCFRSQREGSESRFEGRSSGRSEERQMFDAVCADCGNACKVPFQPTGDKPVFCSNCFGGKKNAGGNVNVSGGKDNFEELNAKLDKILSLLSPAVVEKAEKPAKKEKKTKVTRPSSRGKEVSKAPSEESAPVEAPVTTE